MVDPRRADWPSRSRKRATLVLTISLPLVALVAVVFWQVLSASAAYTKQGNLVGYWPMDEANSQGKFDVSGYGNNLDYGATTQSSSVPTTLFTDNYSQSFNGSQTLYRSNPSGLPTGSSSRTMSVWINPSSGQAYNQSTVYSYGTCGSGNEGRAFGLFLSTSNELNFWGCGSSYDFDIGSSLPANTWTNITMTYDGTFVRVYINGSLRNTQSRSLSTGSSAIQFGSSSQVDSSTNYYRGNLDDARIYNRVLSNAEITALTSGKNTSATWTGASSTSFTTAANWDIGYVPDAYTNIIVPSSVVSGNWPRLGIAAGLANLNNAGTFNLNGYNLTFNSGGKLTNPGTFQLVGGETLTNFVNDTTAGIIQYTGSGTYSSLPTGNNYHSLYLAGSGTWNLPSSTVNITGNFTIGSLATINAGSSTLQVAGDWLNSGNYGAGTSTVVLNGSDQLITGSNTFYSLGKTSSSVDTLTFPAGSTQTITNSLTLSGASGNALLLASSTPGTRWNINPIGSRLLNYLVVKDSDNLNGEVLYPANSTDSGNNTGWFDSTRLTGGSTISNELGTTSDITDIQISSDESNPAVTVKLFVNHGGISLGTTSDLTFYDNNGTSLGAAQPNNVSSLQFGGAMADVNAALATLRYGRTDGATGNDILSASLIPQGSAYYPANGHLYQYVSTPSSWDTAKAAASNSSKYGAQGYLATITSQGENDFILTQLKSDSWIGASDDPNVGTTEGNWIWATGPEASQQFWQGTGTSLPASGHIVNGMYNNWNNSANGDPMQEPNNNNANGENCAEFYYRTSYDGHHPNGTWNDYTCSSQLGYIIEYGGLNNINPTISSKSVSINTTDTIKPSTPSLSPAGGSYTSAEIVTLAAADNTGGSGIDAIYYTIDGSTPSSSSIKYTSAISVNKSETIKAIAYDKAGNASPISSKTYIIARTNTWQGDVSSDWSNPANWSDNIVPDVNTSATVGQGSPWEPTLTANASVANLTINSGSVLALAGHDLAFASDGIFSNNGTLQLNGNETLGNFKNDTNSGDILYSGSDTYGFLPTGADYFSLNFNGTGNWQLPNSTININGDYFVIQEGTVNAGTSIINFRGISWQNSGTFNAGTSTVNFDGQAQTVQGGNTFYNFKKTTTNQSYSLSFADNATQTISHDLTLTGTSTANLVLISYTGSGQWKINPLGTVNLSYLTVQDSNNISGTTLNPPNSGGSGDIGWFFSPPIVSGLGPVNLTSGSWINSATPTLSFTASDSDSDTISLVFEIDDDSNFSSPIVAYATPLRPVGSDSFTVGQATGLGTYYYGGADQTLPDGNYYWRAKSVDNGNAASDWTAANSGKIAFKVDTISPDTLVASPSGGNLSGTQLVSLTAADNTGGSGIDAIYYTIDGSTPSSSSIKYTSAISVNKSETIKAIAYDKAGNASLVLNEDYTVSAPNGQADDSGADRNEPGSPNPSVTSGDRATPQKYTTRTDRTEARGSSDVNNGPASASTTILKAEPGKDDDVSMNHEDTIRLNNAKQNNTNSESTNAFLGLGWWWLLIIIFIVAFWWLIAVKKHQDESKKDKATDSK